MNTLERIVKRIPLLVVMLIVLELVWTNTLVTSGRKVTATDLKIAALRQQNEILAAKVASASALTTISEKAKNAGFIAPTSTQFVMMSESDMPVAFVP